MNGHRLPAAVRSVALATRAVAVPLAPAAPASRAAGGAAAPAKENATDGSTNTTGSWRRVTLTRDYDDFGASEDELGLLLARQE